MSSHHASSHHASSQSADGVRAARHLPSALVCVLGLAACATTDPDPHTGGFVDGLSGLSGGYQRRIDERQAAYQSELDARQRLLAQAQTLEQERAAVRGQLARAEARLVAQQRRIDQERARLLAQSGSTSVSRGLGELDRAQTRADKLARDLHAVDPDALAVADLEARSADIRRQLDEIDALVELVGSAAF